MEFFTDKNKFTHEGKFYAVPIYLDLSKDIPTIAGRNIIFDWLFTFMIFIHRNIVELGFQFWAMATDQEYEAGFPFWITNEIKK